MRWLVVGEFGGDESFDAPHAWVTSHGSLILGRLDADGESCVAPLTIIAAGHWISCTQEEPSKERHF